MIPSSKACSHPASSGLRLAAALGCALGLAACASAAGIPIADADKARRHPDGVAIDPISAPPHASDRADTADGLVTLRTPLGVDRAVATVAEFFRKVVLEDGDGMESVFLARALAVQPGTGGSTTQATLSWQRRLDKLKGKYAQLTGETIYRAAEIQIFRAEDAAFSPHAPAVSPELLEANDVVIRVPILTSRVGADRLFADEMTFWLRRDGERFRIHQVVEDFQLN